MASTRSQLRRRTLMLALALAATALAATSVLSSSAAFTRSTANPGNSFATASSFCAGTSTQTLTSTRDSWVNSVSTATNYGTQTTMDVQVATLVNGVRRSLVGFNLPAIPQFCQLTSATLRLRANTATSGRTINVARADRAWAEGTVNWNTGVAPTGTAVSSPSLSAAGPQTWSVTSLVQQQYTSGVNNGFIVQDSSEQALLFTAIQTYATKENATTANRPQLTLNFGP